MALDSIFNLQEREPCVLLLFSLLTQTGLVLRKHNVKLPWSCGSSSPVALLLGTLRFIFTKASRCCEGQNEGQAAPGKEPLVLRRGQSCFPLHEVIRFRAEVTCEGRTEDERQAPRGHLGKITQVEGTESAKAVRQG